MSFYEAYMEKIKLAVDNIDLKELADLEKAIYRCWENEYTVYLLGNGGSAATATHWVCDFAKGMCVEGKKRLRIIALADNLAHMSAISNDISYDEIFAEQLRNFLRKNDLVVGISASGNSANIIRAFEVAEEYGAVKFAVVGCNGGVIKGMADRYVHIKSDNYGIVEDLHLMLSHMVSQRIKAMLCEQKGSKNG